MLYGYELHNKRYKQKYIRRSYCLPLSQGRTNIRTSVGKKKQQLTQYHYHSCGLSHIPVANGNV